MKHRWFEMKHRWFEMKHRWFEMKHRWFEMKRSAEVTLSSSEHQQHRQECLCHTGGFVIRG